MATLLQTIDELTFDNFYILKWNGLCFYIYIYDHFSGCGKISFVALKCVSEMQYNQNNKILTYYQSTTGVLFSYPFCPVGLFAVLLHGTSV